MEHLYRKVSTIEYNDKLFQVFRDEHGKYAFLRIGEDNKLHFPMIDDFIGLIEIFSNRNKGVLFYIDEEKAIINHDGPGASDSNHDGCTCQAGPEEEGDVERWYYRGAVAEG